MAATSTGTAKYDQVGQAGPCHADGSSAAEPSQTCPRGSVVGWSTVDPKIV
jgi:hypothetical protein